ncbi:MAG: Cys-Gln thioester bond-forming surface protein [Bacilli bacterium]|nr:Cys-Gln thioester bond-forming surface protein [Bacilli bacterium]
MKDKKSFLILLPALVFALTFTLIYGFSASFAWNTDTAVDLGDVVPSGTKYKMLRKNTYSWHLITHNFSSFSSTNASGTKLIETESNINGKKYQAVVFCAEEGKTLSSDSKRTRYSLDDSKVTALSANKKSQLSAVMPYMYPYINLGATSGDSGTLKAVLKSSDKGIGSTDYDKYEFDKLNVNEAITASQAAIWNIQKGKTSIYYSYRGTISSFSAFDSCDEYYTNKIITSEEAAWYNSKGCSSDGNFYKYVYSHKKDTYTKQRIDTLIQWYMSTLQTKLASLGTAESKTFSVTGNNFDSSAKVLTITAKTNIDDYEITFKDNSGNTLAATRSGTSGTYTYTISNVQDNVSSVNWEVKANGTTDNVYYYKASSGQDFIGLERGGYTTSGTIVIERVPEKANLVLYKVSGSEDKIIVKEQTSATYESATCGSSETGCLSNAKFELYYKSGDKKVLYKEIETNYSDTSSILFTDLPLGTYYLRETQPAYGYDLYANGTSIYDASGNNVGTVDAEGFIEIDLTSSKTIAVVVNNVATGICFTKLDGKSGSHALANARYQIEDIDGMVVEIFDTSANNGQEKYCVTNLQAGSYFIRETKAPEGYSLDTKKYHFVLGKSGSSIDSLDDVGTYTTLTPTNGLITFTDAKEVEISKSDMTTGACVQGAELVVRDSSGNIVKDSTGLEIGKWTSKCTCDDSTTVSDDVEVLNITTCTTGYNDYSDGDDDLGAYICTETEQVQTSCDAHKISLTAGTYTLTETMTEELRQQGYSSESETVTFTVKEDGTVAEAVDMKDAPIKACIYKVEKGSTKPLAGATFKLYKEDGTLYKTIKTTETPSNDCLTYIPYGTYYVKEIEAPSGYKAINEEVKIEIKDTKETQYFYVENEVEAPKTALNNTKLLVIISSIFMVFGMGMVGYYVIKKKS